MLEPEMEKSYMLLCLEAQWWKEIKDGDDDRACEEDSEDDWGIASDDNCDSVGDEEAEKYMNVSSVEG